MDQEITKLTYDVDPHYERPLMPAHAQSMYFESQQNEIEMLKKRIDVHE